MKSFALLALLFINFDWAYYPDQNQAKILADALVFRDTSGTVRNVNLYMGYVTWQYIKGIEIR